MSWRQVVLTTLAASESTVDGDEWAAFLASNGEGDIVTGTVTKVVPFGVFVSFGGTVSGFLPRSAVSSLPDAGTEVTLRIDRVDEQRRRVSLLEG